MYLLLSVTSFLVCGDKQRKRIKGTQCQATGGDWAVRRELRLLALAESWKQENHFLLLTDSHLARFWAEMVGVRL